MGDANFQSLREWHTPNVHAQAEPASAFGRDHTIMPQLGTRFPMMYAARLFPSPPEQADRGASVAIPGCLLGRACATWVHALEGY